MDNVRRTYTSTTKAETLALLYDHQVELGVCVLPLFYTTAVEWERDPAAVWNVVCERFGTQKRLIVRSSAPGEDAAESSQAGRFLSQICDNTEEGFREAVEAVLASYNKGEAEGEETDSRGVAPGGSGRKRSCAPEDQFLVQPCLREVSMAGVAFTMDPNTGGHYDVVNIDTSGSTDAVTGGVSSEESRLIYHFKGNAVPKEEWLLKLLDALRKLENFFGTNALDVEFAVTTCDLILLQVRPLVLRCRVADRGRQEAAIRRIRKKFAESQGEKPFLYGSRTIYSNMTDWNPAEMIGVHPRPLARSLYGELITDYTWAYQRDNFGYMRLRSFPLMVDFCGIPYIDVRVSFNSFVPKDLSPKVAEKLVNYYLERLKEDPAKHDKAEFEIVFSCYTFDLPKRIRVLEEYGFSGEETREITDALRRMTNRIINNENGLWRQDEEKIRVLSERYREVTRSPQPILAKLYWLIEDCERYGTLPFAGLARAGFIAVQLLQSMVTEGILSKEEYDDFLSDVSAIGTRMQEDRERLTREDFLVKYGHLRPGTYDITSPRYDEEPERYFLWGKSNRESEERREGKKGSDQEKERHAFRLSLEQLSRIRKALTEHGLDNDVLGLFTFIRSAIEGRESAKFTFTRSLSEVLRLFGQWCEEEAGCSKEEASYADIRIVKEAYRSCPDIGALIHRSIEAGSASWQEGLALNLPPVLIREQDMELFEVPATRPNYITQRQATGEVVLLGGDTGSGERADRQEGSEGLPDVPATLPGKQSSLQGKIVLIPSADPGYDWIFAQGIAGLITAYGGANSHMAIRAGELSIPAVVGAGTKLFNIWGRACMLTIDAALQKVTVL